ncbi:MAG: tetratricopeptide repeat protein [Bacteroidetes bacterium]|nr:tetratricopeptide repeat protein [Bacteroidota bacterium]
MGKTTKILLCTVFSCCFLLVYSQNKERDSLLNLLKNDKLDSTKVKHFNGIGLEYKYSKPDTSLIYFNEALQLAEKIKWKSGKASALQHIGGYHLNKGNYSTALTFYMEALQINEILKDNQAIASNLGNIGIVYKAQGNYPQSLHYYFKALKIAENIKDDDRIAVVIGNIGMVYYMSEDYAKALHYYFKSLKMMEKLNDKTGIAAVNSNIGMVYFSQKSYPNSLIHYFKALKLAEELGNKTGIAITLSNIGNVYQNQLNFTQALEVSLKALELAKQLGAKELEAITLGNIGSLYTDTHDYIQAEKYLLSAIQLCKSIGSRNEESQFEESISELYSKTKRYEPALEHYRNAMRLKDSLFNEEKNKELTRKELNFEFDKKETLAKAEHAKEMAISEATQKKQIIITWITILGLLITFLFAVFMVNRVRITNRQKKIIVMQKNLVETKHKEITDSINYAERIQRSFLSPKNLLDENLKEYFVFFQPKDIVSGDFYWAVKLRNSKFALVIADSTGHGVPGSIMSILNISSLEKAVEEALLVEPAEILNYTRAKIIERLQKDGSPLGGKDGMDASLLVFDFPNKKLTYASANNPIWIVRDNMILEFVPDRMPIGKHEKDTVSFTQHTIQLKEKDMVYALTDGMPDQFGGPRGKKFMYKSLKELLISIAHIPMEEQKQTLKATLINWRGNLEQVDDITLVGIRI